MNAHTWWYVARASGLVAWALATASVVTGLMFSTKLTRRRPPAAWTLDLHRFLGGAAVIATFLHLAGLVGDSYVHFGALEVLVPFASSWKPGPVALGVVAFYLLLAVQGSSMMMRRLPRPWWRAVHLSSFVVFWAATFHLQLSGTDAANPATRVVVTLAMVTVVFLTLVRVLTTDRRRPRRATSPASGSADVAPRPARSADRTPVPS